MNVLSSHRASALLLRRALLLLFLLLSLPFGVALAQAAGSDYTKDLPSVERVKTQIKGTNEDDTLARQAAIFNYLMEYIQRIKENRSYFGSYTPGEIQARTAYSLAAYQIEQNYKKTHSPVAVKAWSLQEGKYEINNALGWIHQLSGAQANSEYQNTEASLEKTQKQHEEQLQKQMHQAFGGGGSAPNGMSSDPASLAVRRCLELGGTSLGCVGKGIGQGFLGMIGLDSKALSPQVAGVTMGGLYHSPNSVTSVSFDGSSAAIENCGTLVADSHPYRIQKNGPSVEITIQNEPSPIRMSLRENGSLAGPGIVTVKGRVIIGYFVETHTHYGRDCPYGCSNTTRTPNYAPKMERCNIATPLIPPSPAQQSAASNSISQLANNPIVGGLLGMANTIAPASKPGIRMVGEYSSTSGLKLSFAGDAVVLDCGQAHVKAPYTVENAPSNFLVHVDNNGGPFTLVVEPDNTLRGSGSTTVNGRLVSGMNGDQVTFTPHSETCHLGTFTPGQHASTSTTLATGPATAPPIASPIGSVSGPASGANAFAPSPAAPSRAQLRVIIHANFAGADPLVGQHVLVMRESIPDALRQLGLPVPAGTSPAQAMRMLAGACRTTNCKPIYESLAHKFLTYATIDSRGKGSLSATAFTGAYYFFATVRTARGTLMWDIPANLSAGDNTVTLTAANAEVLAQ